MFSFSKIYVTMVTKCMYSFCLLQRPPSCFWKTTSLTSGVPSLCFRLLSSSCLWDLSWKRQSFFEFTNKVGWLGGQDIGYHTLQMQQSGLYNRRNKIFFQFSTSCITLKFFLLLTKRGEHCQQNTPINSLWSSGTYMAYRMENHTFATCIVT